MSVRRLAAEQPEAFAFTLENLDWAKDQLKKYPQGREASAVLPLMWRAQEQCGGWLPEPALRYIADLLDMAYIRVYEIATFYTMFNLAPVGRYYVQLCGTTPCWLRGADALKDTCRKLIGEPGHVTKDGLFSWIEVECLGACVNAPMVQINKDYYEDLTPESFEQILVALRDGRKVKPGPQDGRHSSEPFGGPTTLIDPKLYAEEPAGEPHADEVELALVDDEARNPGAAASKREAAVPKPPLRVSSGRRRK
jgi:NADH-quinone oxidoreductase subunit E